MSGQEPIKVGLIGSSIQDSSSPSLHEAEGAAQGLDYSYRLFDLDTERGGVGALPAVLARLAGEGYAGCNVTFPVKQAVLPMLDRLSPEAEAMGAVNVVRFAPDGAREGHNADWWGFGENLRRTLRGSPLGAVALLGAGGAGAAAAYALGRLGATRLIVLDNDGERATEVVRRAKRDGLPAEVRPIADVPDVLHRVDGLVQATPVGMAKHPGMPLDPEALRPELWLAEIIYVPVETELLRRARAIGCRTIHGVGMVVLQAARSFELFTGQTADVARMFASFRSLVQV